MSYEKRKILYKEIEKMRKRPLITYVTSIRPGCPAQMAPNMLPEFIKQLNLIKSDSKAIDLLILSNGGDPIVSWRIISLLREKFDKISVLIPYTAYSAATLLALGANEIIMHPYGNLGPIDPQLNFLNNQGRPMTIGYEDITKYIEFVKSIGITDQELIQRSFNRLTAEIPPTLIGFAKRSAQLGQTMGEKLLLTHMTDENKTKVISETLNTKFYHHGYPLARKEARDIGLPVSKSNVKLEKMLWDICEDFMDEYQFNKEFNPNGSLAEHLSKLQTPPQAGQVNIIKEKIKMASLESVNLNSYVEDEMVASYVMQPDTSLNTNIIINSGTWINKEGDDNSEC